MIKLYLDEDVPEAVAMALKLRGYDVLTTREADKRGLTDIAQLEYASSEERILITHNIADFSINSPLERSALAVIFFASSSRLTPHAFFP